MKITFLCSPGIGILEGWMPIIWKLKKEKIMNLM